MGGPQSPQSPHVAGPHDVPATSGTVHVSASSTGSVGMHVPAVHTRWATSRWRLPSELHMASAAQSDHSPEMGESHTMASLTGTATHDSTVKPMPSPIIEHPRE